MQASAASHSSTVRIIRGQQENKGHRALMRHARATPFVFVAFVLIAPLKLLECVNAAAQTKLLSAAWQVLRANEADAWHDARGHALNVTEPAQRDQGLAGVLSSTASLLVAMARTLDSAGADNEPQRAFRAACV